MEKSFSYTWQYIHFRHAVLYFSRVIIKTENSTPGQTPAESLFTNIANISDGGEARHTKKQYHSFYSRHRQLPGRVFRNPAADPRRIYLFYYQYADIR